MNHTAGATTDDLRESGERFLKSRTRKTARVTPSSPFIFFLSHDTVGIGTYRAIPSFHQSSVGRLIKDTMAVPTSLESHGISVDISLTQGQEGSSHSETEEVLDGDGEREENEGNIIRSGLGDGVSSLVLPKCKMPPMEELKPVQAFVANAVCSSEGSKSLQSYRAILDCLRKREDPPMLLKILLALRTAGSTLHHLTGVSKRHAHLVHLIFRLDPFDPPVNNTTKSTSPDHMTPYQNCSLADAHLHLLVAMVSANSVFLTPAMNAIWRLIQTEASSERSIRLHAALSTLLRLVPKGNTELFPVLASHFPFRTKPRSELEWYTRQCLVVTKYAPVIHHQLLELLVDKCLEIDVEIKIEDGGNVAIEDDNDLFELDMDALTNDVHSKDDKENDVEKVDEMADKVCGTGYYEELCSSRKPFEKLLGCLTHASHCGCVHFSWTRLCSYYLSTSRQPQKMKLLLRACSIKWFYPSLSQLC